MRTITFASRNTKEITRDILTLIFGIAFPLILPGIRSDKFSDSILSAWYHSIRSQLFILVLFHADCERQNNRLCPKTVHFAAAPL